MQPAFRARAWTANPLCVPVGPAQRLSAHRASWSSSTGRRAPRRCWCARRRIRPARMISAAELRDDPLRWCARAAAMLISDEIYHGLTYGECGAYRAGVRRRRVRDQQLLQVFRHDRTAAGLDGRARGVHARRRQACRATCSSPRRISAQHAALAAFDPETIAVLEERRELYRAQRDFLLPALQAARLRHSGDARKARSISMPTAAASPTTATRSAGTCWRRPAWRSRPGLDFGDNDPRHHVRVSYPKPIAGAGGGREAAGGVSAESVKSEG